MKRINWIDYALFGGVLILLWAATSDIDFGLPKRDHFAPLNAEQIWQHVTLPKIVLFAEACGALAMLIWHRRYRSRY